MPALLMLSRYALAAGTALVLAACSSTPQLPSLTSGETAAAITEGMTTAQSAVEAFAAGESMAAIGTVGAPSVVASQARPATAPRFDPLDHSDDDLVGGTYEYDPIGETFIAVDTSTAIDYLQYLWTYEFDAAERDAEFLVAWPETRVVVDPYDVSYSSEVPTELELSLAGDGKTLAEASVLIGYVNAVGCGYIYEPASLVAEGFIGTEEAMMTFTGDFSQTASRIATSGDVDLAAGGDSAGVDWDVVVNGDFGRTNCIMDEPVVTSGSITLGAYANEHDFLFDVDFEDVVTDSESGPSADVDGSLRVNGTLAVAFSGNLNGNDSNSNGYPGEDLVLTFRDGETLTLEQFLIEQAEPVITAVRLLSALN